MLINAHSWDKMFDDTALSYLRLHVEQSVELI